MAEGLDPEGERPHLPPDGSFDELLTSPVHDTDRSRRRAWWLGAVFVVLVAAVVSIVALNGPGETERASTATSQPSGELTTLSVDAPMSLEPYDAEPALLYYPTVLPEGWDLCRQLEDISKGDRFCAPNDDDTWLQIAVKDHGEVRLTGTPVRDIPNAQWVTVVGETVLAVPSGEFQVVLVEGSGIPNTDVVAIAETIPLIGDRDALYADYEVPLDLQAVPGDALGDLLSTVDPEPRVAGRRTGEAQVYAETVSLSVFTGGGPTLPDFAATIPLPRLVPADRPLVVGESPSRSRSYAFWDQRGFSWRLEGRVSLDETYTLALSVIEKVAALEPASS